MRKICTLLFIFLVVFSNANSQENIIGEWNGVLSLGGQQLSLVFHFEKVGTTYSGSLDSPDQKAFGIKADKVIFEKDTLDFIVSKIGLRFKGFWADTTISGEFTQGYFKTPLQLSRRKVEKKVVVKPQEPQDPFPYLEEEIVFHHVNANFDMAGTLTLPEGEGVFPLILLISGSGPQDRNEEILGHKPFLIIADYLTKKGYAVFRYDDRGTAKSGGKFEGATSPDFASDAASALAYLKTRKDINTTKIALAGHSEGAMLAAMIAANDSNINAIIMLAGPGIPGDQLLLMQQELIATVNKGSPDEIKENTIINRSLFELINKSNDIESATITVEKKLKKISKKLSKSALEAYGGKTEFVSQNLRAYINPWMYYFLRYDPAVDLKKIKCNVLALNGNKDLQVPSKVNLAAIELNINNPGKIKQVIEMPNLNHLFQNCLTGNITEYGEIQETISPEVLEKMNEFLTRSWR
jgi:pimeloyl-ACP methyl ester carboxylesterase